MMVMLTLCVRACTQIAWAGIERLAQGWAEPPPPPLQEPGAEASAAAPGGSAGGDGREWVDLRPRWPLTGERHPRCV